MNTHKEARIEELEALLEEVSRTSYRSPVYNHIENRLERLKGEKHEHVWMDSMRGTECLECHYVEPTPPSQIEEELAMAEHEYNRNITPLRDLEQRVRRLEEAINKLTKEK